MDLTHEPQIIDELFRKVRPEEILEDLKELGVDIRDQTLKNPSPEEALGLYGLAIQVVFGKTRADIRPEDVYSQIHVFNSGVEGLDITEDNLDFLKRGIGNLRFWRYCQKLHDVLGLPEIERLELFSPTQESFYRFISTFVVYLRFREALKSLFEDAVARLNFAAEQESQLVDNIRQVKEEYENFKKLKEDNTLDVETSANDREQLEQLLLQARNVFNDHKEAKAKVDAELGKVKIEVNDIQLNRTKLRHANESLSEQVVSDPECLHRQKSELEQEDAAQTTVLKGVLEAYEQAKQRLNRLEECNDFLVSLKEKLTQHLEEVLKPIVENATAAKTLKARNEVLHEQIKHHKAKREETQKSLLDARQEHEEKLRMAEENAEGKLKIARKFSEETHETVQKIQQQISQGNARIEELKSELARRKELLGDIFRELDGNLRKVAGASDSYATGMENIMNEIHRTVAGI